MIGQNCVLMSQEIRDVAKELNISDELSKHLVGVWQMQNNSAEVPTANNLRPLLQEIKNVNYNSLNSRNRYRKVFSPQVLEKRIQYIAVKFSEHVGIKHREVIRQLKEDIEEIASSEDLSKKAKNRKLFGLRRKLAKLQDSENGRKYFLSTFKIEDILDSIKEEFTISEEDNIEYYGEEQGKYISQQQALLLEFFDELFADATHIIEGNENVRISNNGRIVNSTQDISEEVEEELEEEESHNDGWGMQAKFTDPRLTTLASVKRILGSIEKVDKEGNVIVDDMGEVEYMNSNTTYQTLLHELSKRLLSAEDFSIKNEDGTYYFPALEDIKLAYPWVQQVINTLNDNTDLISAFYASFRQVKSEIWINSEGSPVSENTDLASRSILKSATNNYITGNIINEETSIYNKSGNINVSKAKKIYEEIADKELDLEEIKNLLEGIGFDIPLYVLEGIYGLENITDLEVIEKRKRDLNSLMRNVKNVYSTIKDLNSEDNLVEAISTYYNEIASQIGIVSDFSTLVSIRVGNKALQAYTYPSAIDILVGNLTQEDESKVQQYIVNKFLYSSWFLDNKGNIKSPWLDRLFNDELSRKALKIIDLPLAKIRGKEVKYTELKDSPLRSIMVSQYFAGGRNKVYYNFPLFSDSPIIKFLSWNEDNRLGGKDNLSIKDIKNNAINNLVTVIKQEIDRMVLVQKRSELGVTKVTNFDSRGSKFCFIPSLNTYRSSTYDSQTLLEVLRGKKANKTDSEVIYDYLSEILERDFAEAYQFNDKGYAIDRNLNQSLSNIKSNNKHLRKFTHKDLMLEYFYNSQFAQSQIIELTVTDLAYFKNMDDFQKRYKEVYASGKRLNTSSKYGRKIEKAIYLVDPKITSYSYDIIEDNIMKNKTLSNTDSSYLKKLASKYKDIVATDGQSYRHIDSYKSIMDMTGQWSPEQELALQQLKRGEITLSNLLTVWQSIKPFVFTQLKTPAGNGEYLKVPHQHKNSEFAFLLFANNFLMQSERMKAINSFMENNDIDVIHFTSVVKHGISGVIDINDVPDSEIEDYMTRILKQNESKGENIYLYEVPYDDYHIAQNTPEHFFDTEASFGSQLRVLLVSDLSDNFNITLPDGRKYAKKELLKHYDSLIIENLLESTEEVLKSVGSIEKVQKMLLSQVEGNPKYGRDIIEALQLIQIKKQDGTVETQFNLPLWDPSITEQLQEIFFSTFKNRITKQKINGGKATAVSSFCFSDKLKVQTDNNSNIKGIECFLPAWSRSFFDKYLDMETGEVDIEVIKQDAPELLKVIGYRIPTENKYSMFPLIVKGFLPLQSGGSIMLPVEAITMSGMDFDIDSVYLMFKNFTVEDDGTVVTDKYNPDKSYADNTKEARDNEIIDLAHAILCNNGDKIFNCNNFDTIEKMANIIRIIEDPTMMSKVLGHNISTKDISELVTRLLKANGDNIIKFVKENSQERNPLSPETFIHYHQMNMVGGALIGMYANSSTNLAKTQRTDLSLADKYVINLNGNTYRNLSDIRDKEGNLISLKIAEFLAASVDNGKNPVLGDLRQTTDSARLTSVLVRLGIPIEDIALFFNVPSYSSIDLEAIKHFDGGSSLINSIESVPYKSVASQKFTRKEWLSAILMNKFPLEELHSSGLLAEYLSILYKTQYLREKYESEIVPIMSLVTSTHRADSPNGAVAHNLGLAMTQLFKMDKLQNSARISYPSIHGLDQLLTNIDVDSPFSRDFYRDTFSNMAMPMVQAFHTLGIQLAVKSANKWFLNTNSYILDSIRYLNSLSSNGYVSDSIIRSYLFGLHEYFQKTNSLFGNSEESTLIEKQEYYKNEFPKEFLRIKSLYPKIAEIPIIKRMTVEKGKIILNDSTHLPKTVRDLLSSGFEMLLNMESGDYTTDYVAIKLATDLFKYSFYKDNLTFGPNNFGYLFNTAFKNSISEYISTERNLMALLNDSKAISNFTTQFIARKYPKLGLYYVIDKDVAKIVDSSIPEIQQSIIVTKWRKDVGKEPPQYITYNGILYEFSGEFDDKSNKPIYEFILDDTIISYDPNIITSLGDLRNYKHINRSKEQIDDTTTNNFTEDYMREEDLPPLDSSNLDGSAPVVIGETSYDVEDTSNIEYFNNISYGDSFGDFMESFESNKFIEENPIDKEADENVCRRN